MNFTEAIFKSEKGTATRVEEKDGKTFTTVKYLDGSGFILISQDGKIDFINSRIATEKELEDFNDWEPTK